MSNTKLGLMLQGDRVNLNGHKHEHNGHACTTATSQRTARYSAVMRLNMPLIKSNLRQWARSDARRKRESNEPRNIHRTEVTDTGNRIAANEADTHRVHRKATTR